MADILRRYHGCMWYQSENGLGICGMQFKRSWSEMDAF